MRLTLDHGDLILSDIGRRWERVKDLGLKYDRRHQTLSGACTLDRLEQLAAIGRLPDNIESIRRSLYNTQLALENEKKDPDPQPLFPYPVKAALYNHQIRAANCAMRVFTAECGRSGRGFAYLMDMGTGKSLTTIATAGALYQSGRIGKMLVVCPSSLCFVWAEEFARFADFPFNTAIMQGDKIKRLAALNGLVQGENSALEVAVINYESTFREGIAEALERFDADLIICDESQRIKSPSAAQSKQLHRLGERARYKLILTGTPIQNKVMDIFSQYKFLDSSVFGSNFYAFKNRYVILGGYQQHEVIGYKNTDELKRKMHSIAYRVKKEECLDLPAQTFETRTLEFDAAAKRIYNKLAKESVAELERGEITASTVVTKLLRLRQLTGGFVKADGDTEAKQCNTVKLDALREIVEDYVIEGGKKLVVFTCFKAEIAAISGMLQGIKVGHCVIDGDVIQTERGPIVESFQNDPETKVFIGQLQTTGVGLTLTAASTAVFYSMDFNYANYTQALARIHRIGQKEKVTYITLAVRGTVDTKIKNDLAQKGVTAENFVDHWRDYFGEIDT